MTDPTMTLHPFIFPRVRPGTYAVEERQTMTGGGLQAADTLPSRTQHIEVTAPRFSLPGTEVFGVFPPPNATGPFAGRLAQIVLRSRTLPWDRSSSAALPWLALVVLADGEANFLPDVPAATAYTPGFAPTGIPADARAATLEVPQKVINDAFPAAGELDLLAHVRHVDPTETEYADSDGWVSVLIANRLPQPSTAYGAYLISLEGQLDRLPDPGAVANESGKTGVFDDLFDMGDLLAEIPRLVKTVPFDPRPPVVGPTRAFTTLDARPSAAPRAAAEEPVTMVAASTRLVRHDVNFAELEDLVAIDPAFVVTSRYPVLAYWEFSCSEESGDFAGYMNHLDVGLLGTAPIVDHRAPVVPVTASGHLAIAHTDRRGDAGQAWYRGPFTPTKITREPAGQPYHVADQARRVGPDGREDLAYAAAFEVGRLLAMSDLQFLRALRQWVRQEFVSRRTQDVVEPYLGELGINLPFDVLFGRELSKQLLIPGGFGGDPVGPLGNPLPLHEAELMFAANDPQVMARGFGLEPGLVADVLGVQLTNEVVEATVIDLGVHTFDDVRAAVDTLGGLRSQLGGLVGDLEVQITELDRDRIEGTGGPLLDQIFRGRR